MKHILFIIASSIIFFSCAPSKELEISTFEQKPCHSEERLRNEADFTSETVENLLVFRQDGEVHVSMDVRGYCGSKYEFDIERQSDRIKVRLINENMQRSLCICTSNITASFSLIGEGEYLFMVTDIEGTQLLAQKSIILKE